MNIESELKERVRINNFFKQNVCFASQTWPLAFAVNQSYRNGTSNHVLCSFKTCEKTLERNLFKSRYFSVDIFMVKVDISLVHLPEIEKNNVGFMFYGKNRKVEWDSKQKSTEMDINNFSCFCFSQTKLNYVRIFKFAYLRICEAEMDTACKMSVNYNFHH